MNDLIKALPIIIPAILLHLTLAIISLTNIYKHKKVKCFNIITWVFIILLIQTLGSIAFLLYGRVDE